MFEALRVAQVAMWIAIAVWGGLLTTRHASSIDGLRLTKAMRGRCRSRQAELLRRCDGPIALLAPVLEQASADDAALLLAERWVLVERACARGLPWLRVLGMSASALGFAAVAFQISWLHADHGLLDLDPARVSDIASERAATALALAVAGSGTAVALGSAARAQARRVGKGAVAIRDLIERQLAGWTTPATKC